MILIALAIVLRMMAAVTGPLIDDEAYYWLWARHLDWGYLDHPPLIAWLIFLGTQLGDSALLIRLPALALGALTTYTLFLFGRDLFGIKAGVMAALVFQVTPVLAGAGLLATPDAPLFLAWILTLRLVWQALHGQPERWVWAGAALGIGMLSKLTMVLLPMGILLYVALRSRSWLRRPEPYAAVAIALAIFTPVIYWNVRHQWAGLKFIIAQRLGGDPLGLTGLWKLLEEQPAFVLVLFPAFIWALVVALRAGGRDERLVFLGWTSVPILIAPFIPAYAGGWPHGNWLGPGYLALCLVLGGLWNRTTAALALVNGLAILYALAASIIPAVPLPPGTVEVYGWKEAGARAGRELATPNGPAVIVADRYQIAAQLAYHARADAVTMLPCPPLGSIWPPLEGFSRRNALAVIDARWEPAVRWWQYAAEVTEARPLTVAVRGRPLRTFRFLYLDRLIPPVCPG